MSDEEYYSDNDSEVETSDNESIPISNIKPSINIKSIRETDGGDYDDDSVPDDADADDDDDDDDDDVQTGGVGDNEAELDPYDVDQDEDEDEEEDEEEDNELDEEGEPIVKESVKKN